MLLNPSVPALVYLYSGEFDVIQCYVTDRDWGRMQHRRLSLCGVMSVALFIHAPPFLYQAAILLTSWWQTSQNPWLSVRDSCTHLAEAPTLLTVPLFFCCFLTAKETQLKSLSSSGSAPAWALFLVWQWNGTFRFCFMHFLFLPKIYIRPRNLFFFFFCSHSFFFPTLVIFACLWFAILLSCPRFLSLWLIFSGLQKQKIRQNLKGKKRAI